jgi:isopentenyl diphosphate isomerase/L-lactate dehydrogenase-like FMN-dependent dehydrogenase
LSLTRFVLPQLPFVIAPLTPSPFHQPSDDKVTEKGGSTSEKLFAAVDPNLAWEDITWIRKIAPDLPLVIKGVQCVEVCRPSAAVEV